MGHMGKTWTLVGALTILTAALLYLSLFENKNPAPAPQVTVTPTKQAAKTSLSFSDEQKYASGSSLLKTDILIDSKDNKITGAQIELIYDPKVLSKIEIIPGDFLKDSVEVLKKIDVKTGRISYVLGSKLNKNSHGAGIIATITYLRLTSSITTIDFLPQTLITAQGFSESALVDSKSAVLGLKPSIFQNNSTASSTIR